MLDPYINPVANAALQNLSRIHQSLRIQRFLNRPHHVHFDIAFVMCEFVALELANTMFSRNAAAVLGNDVVYRAVDLGCHGCKRNRIAAFGLREIEMQIAIA